MDTPGVRSPIGVGTEGELASDGLLGLRATIDLAPIGLAQFDHEGRFLLANDRLCEILGCARTDLLARTFQEITFPEDLGRCLQLTGRLAANEIPSYCVDKRFVRPDGLIVWTRITVSAVRRTDGTVAFFIGAAEDITNRSRKAQAMRLIPVTSPPHFGVDSRMTRRCWQLHARSRLPRTDPADKKNCGSSSHRNALSVATGCCAVSTR